jgi:kynurenine formamidase
MRIRSFIIAYALVLAILLFADRRPGSIPPDRYSHVVDLTDEHAAATRGATASSLAAESGVSRLKSSESWPLQSKTRIIAPAALIPGTWTAGQIPAERLVAPLVVMDVKAAAPPGETCQTCCAQISLDDVAAWESLHGMIPQGAVVAIRRIGANDAPAQSHFARGLQTTASMPLPITHEAAMFLIEARYTIGFAVETPVTLSSDRALAQQLALHGNYVVEESAPLTALPATGTLVIVAPAKNKKSGETPVRVLAMVR